MKSSHLILALSDASALVTVVCWAFAKCDRRPLSRVQGSLLHKGLLGPPIGDRRFDSLSHARVLN
jgi:hypothetical protein